MLSVDYIVNSVFNSRTYILSDGSDKVWLVDCGDMEPLLSIVGDRRVEGVFLTHAHFDHIYGLPSLIERFPDVVIYINEWGKQALADDKLNMSRYHESPVKVVCFNVRVVGEGDKVCGFDVYETPGHNPSCLCYVNNEVIFTGDAYIPGCKVVTNLPHCDKTLAEVSIERILKLAEGKIVFPGHDGFELRDQREASHTKTNNLWL